MTYFASSGALNLRLCMCMYMRLPIRARVCGHKKLMLDIIITKQSINKTQMQAIAASRKPKQEEQEERRG